MKNSTKHHQQKKYLSHGPGHQRLAHFVVGAHVNFKVLEHGRFENLVLLAQGTECEAHLDGRFHTL